MFVCLSFCFISVQALELRERCVCPALPATDPRDVFSKSVRVLLKNTREWRAREGRQTCVDPQPHLSPHKTACSIHCPNCTSFFPRCRSFKQRPGPSCNSRESYGSPCHCYCCRGGIPARIAEHQLTGVLNHHQLPWINLTDYSGVWTAASNLSLIVY